MLTKKLHSNDTDMASSILKDGGIVALPTETVYGLAANAFNASAVKKIFKAKKRPMDNPLIVHISMFDDIYNLTPSLHSFTKKLADAFWPGPLTIIIPGYDNIPREVSAGLKSIAVRIPAHSVTLDIIKKCGFPLAAPSANLSGKPSPTCASHVLDDLDGMIDAIIDGGNCSVGLESTVITLCSEVPCILRPGVITQDEIEKVIGRINIDPAVFNNVSEDRIISSPGMKYKHYSPNSDVIIIIGPSEKYIEYVNCNSEGGTAALCFENEKKRLNVPCISYGEEFDYKCQASLLFSSLRKFDIMGAKTIFVHCSNPQGIGIAVYNRLIRAAGFEVMSLV